MGRPGQLAIVFLAPVALVAALLGLALVVPLPSFGQGHVLRIALPAADRPIDLPPAEGPQDRSRPLVVIDPGHGGADPGAVVAGVREKDVTLAMALALRDALLGEGGVRVALTRSEDRFLVLAERPEIARRMDADLFVSIHADSAGEREEGQDAIEGASIYTLSDEASSEAAARFAARENRAGRINGVGVDGQSAAVSSILVELSQRRTREGSGELAALVLREADGVVPFHPQARRSASLAVLRAPDVPAVLLEAGYLTSERDAARLTTREGREAFARATARAIRIFLARRATDS